MPKVALVNGCRRIVVALVAFATLAVGAPSVPAAAGTASATVSGADAEVYPVPPNGVFTVRGHGWGHGHGMSQYGAYGAAKVRGLTYREILAFYYPHTSIAGLPLDTPIKVLLHSTAADRLVVAPRDVAELTVSTDVDGVAPCTLPKAVGEVPAPVRYWRARVVSTPDGDRLRLQVTTDGETWSRARPPDCDDAWRRPLDGSITFDNGGTTSLVRGTATAPYRGALRAAFTGSRVFVVNVARIDDYLRSVVPSEMPSSWSPAALQAQAVAARTYASYGIAHPKNKPYYDVYDDTRDQMYLGKAREAASTNAAVEATEDADAETGDVLKDGEGNLAFTQFSSSDGGWTVSGGRPYMPAQEDPYDGLVPSSVHTWSATVSVSTISSAYRGQIGALRSITVTGRDGNGDWGGRVTALTLRGSDGSVDLTGSSFRYALGLRSEWFRIVPPPGRPTHVTAERDAGTTTVTWDPPADTGTADVRGYRVVLRPSGRVVNVAAGERSAVFTDVPARGARTVSVAATSKVGPGFGRTVTTKVHRIAAGNDVDTAVAVSVSAFGDGTAGAVILARRSIGPETAAAAVLAAAHHAPVLLTASDAVPAVTEAELRRVLPAGGTVHLLGNKTTIQPEVRARLRALGYVVTRHGGATPAATARSVANDVAATSTVSAVFEVDAGDPTSAWAAGPAAAATHGVVLLTGGGAQAPETAGWLRHHPDVTTRYAVGAAAAAADPGATAIGGSGPVATAVAVARRFAPAPPALAVVAPTQQAAGLLASAAVAVRHGAVLVAAPAHLPAAAAAYVGDVRAGVRRADLVGADLPYDDVESDLQHALLG